MSVRKRDASWLIVLLALSVASRTAAITLGGVPISIDPQALIEKWGSADIGSYLRLAVDLATFKVSDENLWIASLWPPGQSMLMAACILIGGNFVLNYSVITALIWWIPSTLAWLIFQNHPKTSDKSILMLSGVAVWNFLPALLGFFSSTGIVFGSDLQGIALLSVFQVWILSVTLGFVNDQNGRHLALIAGATLGTSLFFRWAYVGVVIATLLCFSAVACVNRVKNLQTRLGLPETRPKFLIAGLLITTLPFTIFRAITFPATGLSWTSGTYMWAQRWMSDDFLAKQNAQWVVDGGSNWAFHVADRETRDSLQILAESGDPSYFEPLRGKAFSVIANHPIEFLIERFRTLPAFIAEPIGPEYPAARILPWVSLAIVLTGVVFLVISRAKILPTVASISLFALLFLPLLIEHWESRYLYPIYAVLFWELLARATAIRGRSQDANYKNQTFERI